jgi:hypothetical protein
MNIDKLVESARVIVETYGMDEESHFEECGCPDGHIFHHLKVLSDFVSTIDCDGELTAEIAR